MSENQSLQNSSDAQSIHPLGNMDGVSQLMNSTTHQTRPLETEPIDLWEAVEPASIHQQSAEEIAEETAQSTAKVGSASRETELLALIHDLNECNDVLLTRVSQLEENLEKTQAASKAEVEKAQAAAQDLQERMSKQVSAEHASVQQVSHNAQQQVAKVVTQLETTEQALSRQQLINENLQTELDNSLERIAQLERDCTLNAQKHAEEAKAKVKAETTSRDLKARLQRQQRYTLQFKAALEKSLTVSARTKSNPITAERVRPVPFKDTASVVMPKAQRIMPWASATSTSPFQGIDPHLETLIRSVGKPSEPDATESKANAPKAVISEPVTSEAETKLWQDLERIMDTATVEPTAAVVETVAVIEPEAKAAIAPEIEAIDSRQTVEESPTAAVIETPVELSESVVEKPESEEPGTPKLNWQAKSKAGEDVSTLETPSEEPVTDATGDVQATPQIAPIDIEKSFAAATRKRLETAVTFTEPSPWGKPLPQKIEAIEPMPVAAQVTSPQSSASPQRADSYDYLPATEGTTDSSVAPVVKPLHMQKKIGSLASVELPTFPNAKVASFKR